MSNEVTTPKNTGLGALGALKTGLANVRAKMPEAGGKGILRMLQETDGWVFGQEDNALPLGTEVVVNPLSIKHGYSCWTDRAKGEGKNELLKELLYPISQQAPALHELDQLEDPKTGVKCAWKDLIAMEMKILSGKHSGTEISYKPTSVGGMNASRTVLDAILSKLDEDTPFVCPVVELQQDNYKHASYGKTYTPEFKVVGWMDLEGNEEGDDTVDGPAAVARKEPEPEPEVEKEEAPVAEEAPARRKRRA
jgi:hypothetical protein